MTSFIKNQVIAFKNRFQSHEPQFVELSPERLAHIDLGQHRDFYQANLALANRYTLLTKRSALMGMQRTNALITKEVMTHPSSQARSALLQRVAELDEQLRWTAAAAADFDKTLDESMASQKSQVDILQSAVETVSHFTTAADLQTLVLALQDARDTIEQSAKDDDNEPKQRVRTWGKLDKAIDAAMKIFTKAVINAGSAQHTPRR